MARWEIVEVRTRAGSKLEFISNPALGRELDGPSAQAVADNSPEASDLQILIGDGLSAEAVRSQIPKLLPVVVQEAQARGWRIGRPFLIRHCRVGVMNQVGELLDARVVVLLIGERPGMSTVDSLSAYMAYRPRYGHSDADRNVISNIHSCGTNVDEAARRIVNLAAEFMRAGRSGTLIKEPPLPDSSRTLSNDR